MFRIHKLDFLIALYVFCICVSELMGGKTFPVLNLGGFHLTASVAVFVIPVIFSIYDIVVEVLGTDRARSLLGSGLIVVLLILLYGLLATHLPPSYRYHNEKAYDKIFGSTIRIAAASLIAFAASGILDILVFSKLRAALHKKALWLRNNLSNFISQLVDSTVFITLAFYATTQTFGHNVPFLLGLIIPYWLLKCAMSVIETPLVYAGVRWLRTEARADVRP